MQTLKTSCGYFACKNKTGGFITAISRVYNLTVLSSSEALCFDYLSHFEDIDLQITEIS